MAAALILALSLLATDATTDRGSAGGGEPLPAGAPTDDYELTGWCFGALGEYLDIYDKVKPDLIEIDKTWGTSVKESEPYASDIAAARTELKVLAGALEAAEKASPQPIAPQGAASIKKGQSIWLMVENRPRRELARAWLTWGLPDQCGATARTLAAKSSLLGKALTYNNKPDSAKALAPAPSSDGPLTIQPIAPVRRAEPAPTPSPLSTSSPSPAPADMATAPPSPAPEEAQSSNAPPALAPTDVAVARPQPRVVDENPTSAEPSSVKAAPPPKATPATSTPPPTASPTSDESSEPVL